MKISRVLFFTGALAVGSLPLPLRAELVNGVKAVVHDSVITYDEVESLTAQTADVLARKYAGKPEEFDKKIEESRSENLDKLMSRQLILHDFKTAGYNIPESILDDEVQTRIKARYQDRMRLTKTLQAEGLTYEKFRQQIRDQIIVEVMRQKNISSELIISPHKIETYYLAHKDDYKLEDEVKLRMIVLTKSGDSDPARTRTRAQEVLSKLKEGASFAEMAGIYSQGSQRNQGGDWGWVEKSVLRPELATVAFALKPGDLSDIIDTPEAYYLMLVEDKRASHYKTLGEVREQVERTLMLEEHNRLEKQYTDRLRKKTFVRYF